MPSTTTDFPSGTVTFLFTDVEGSTRQLQRMGESYASLLVTLRKLMRAAFHKFHGHEVDTQGDSFFVAFARAPDAIAASVAAQRALAKHAWPSGERVRVRMGLHTGAPQLTTAGYVGLDVHTAARLCAAAHGGQVLLSQTTRDLVEPSLPVAVTLRDLGEHGLKDLNEPRRIFQLVISDLPDEFPPLRTLDALPHNLPIQLTSFIGRASETQEIKQLLFNTTRLLTLTGAGGAGKTRLALQVAADLVALYDHGVWLVELAPLADLALVPKAVAAVFGVREQPGQPILNSLVDQLRSKNMLLLLDNCEHLIDASARLVDALLRACPNLRILATSRQALGIAGETAWMVPSLSLPDMQQPPSTVTDLSQSEAVQLFVARAVAVQPGFRLSASNASAVAQVCRRLDGIPLALELAAARVKVLKVENIAARLDDRFSLLTTGSRTALPRHQTLRAAVDWSYDLLAEPEQVLLRRLSVFAGGCTLEAAEQVCADQDRADGILSHQILDLVSHLVDKSLVVADQQGDETRYRMLETIRQYASEKLDESGESEHIQERHLEFFFQLAQAAEPQFVQAELFDWFDRIEHDLDNIRAALAWAFKSGDWDRGLGVATALFEFWKHRGYASEARRWLTRFLERVGQARQTCLVAGAYENAAMLASQQDDYVEAVRLIEASFAILRVVDDRRGIAIALLTLGAIREWQNDIPAARACYEESLQISTELKLGYKTAHAYYRLGNLEADQEKYDIAQKLVEKGLVLGREQKNKLMIAHSLESLGVIASRQQNYLQATSLLQEALSMHRAANLRYSIAWTLFELGQLALYTENYARARETLVESVELSVAVGNRWNTLLCVDTFAALAAAQGQHVRAAQLLAASITLRETIVVPILALQRQAHEQRLADLRRQMQEAEFERAWAEGRAMTMDRAIEYALQVPHEPVPPPPISGQAATQTFAGLTARERQVSAHIAQGESNHEIAQALVISERTVETHVTNILNKLGFTTRAQIRKWAREKGMVRQEK